jgi:hypothetical protein
LSDVVGGALLGCVWLSVLGLAYRRHVARSFWMGPLAWIFYGSFLASAAWHAQHRVDAVLAEIEPPEPTLVLRPEDWWRSEWQVFPDRRVLLTNSSFVALDVQLAGSLESLQTQLETRGWQSQEPAGWIEAIGLLDGTRAGDAVPVLPASLAGRAEALLLRKQTAEGVLLVLRLWPAPARLADDAPLWIGSLEALELARPFGLVEFWRLAPDGASALPLLVEDLGRLEMSLQQRSKDQAPVLLLRSSP